MIAGGELSGCHMNTYIKALRTDRVCRISTDSCERSPTNEGSDWLNTKPSCRQAGRRAGRAEPNRAGGRTEAPRTVGDAVAGWAQRMQPACLLLPGGRRGERWTRRLHSVGPWSLKGIRDHSSSFTGVEKKAAVNVHRGIPVPSPSPEVRALGFRLEISEEVTVPGAHIHTLGGIRAESSAARAWP